MQEEKFKVLLFLKKSVKDKKGKTPIMGRITIQHPKYGNSVAQFSSKLSCAEKLWNARESRLNGKSKVAVEINAKLDKINLSVNEAYATLQKRNKPFVAEDVKNLFQGTEVSQTTLLQAFDTMMEEFKTRIGIDRSRLTLYKYDSCRRCVADFIKRKYKSKDIFLNRLNEQFIREFQDHLILKLKRANGTVRHDISLLKKACTIAFRAGLCDRHYFSYYKIPKQLDNPPKALTREQFEAIRDLEIAPHRKSHLLTRDMFIFSCLTGVAYADVVVIKTEHITTDDDGAKWLKFHRKKNDMLCRIKLLPEAIAIIEKYHDANRDTIFPLQLYGTTGSNMRTFKAMIGADYLSYHQARHSFSTLITLEQGVPIETVSRMLGHSDMKTTQIYAKVTPARLFEDMAIFIDYTKDLHLIL